MGGGQGQGFVPQRLAQRLLVLNQGKISAIELRLQLLLEESRLGQQFQFDELSRAKLTAPVFHHRQSLITTFLAPPSRQQDAGIQEGPGHASPPRLCFSSFAMPSLSSSSPPDRMNLSRRARSFLPVAVLGFHSESGWRASFSETADRMNSLRLGSGMRLRSDSGIFTFTACSVLVIPRTYYPSHYSQAYSCSRLDSRSVFFFN